MNIKDAIVEILELTQKKYDFEDKSDAVNEGRVAGVKQAIDVINQVKFEFPEFEVGEVVFKIANPALVYDSETGPIIRADVSMIIEGVEATKRFGFTDFYTNWSDDAQALVEHIDHPLVNDLNEEVICDNVIEYSDKFSDFCHAYCNWMNGSSE